jgi:hypothetical protein
MVQPLEEKKISGEKEHFPVPTAMDQARETELDHPQKFPQNELKKRAGSKDLGQLHTGKELWILSR